MRTRLMLSAVCILILPFVFSTTDRPKLVNASPFATIAYAGHTTSGNWCDCGTPGCLCEPGANPDGNSAAPVSNGSSDQRLSPIRDTSADSDLGTGALILAFALLVWARLRA